MTSLVINTNMDIKAEQIKAHRKALGLTQRAYAARYNVSEQLVRLYWEKRGISKDAVGKAEALTQLAREIEGGL
jgi:DNA-binding transcriptional regulator YiaG